MNYFLKIDDISLMTKKICIVGGADYRSQFSYKAKIMVMTFKLLIAYLLTIIIV